VDGDGVVGLRPDGRFGFTRLLLRLEVEVEPGHEEQARELAEKAEAGCLVSVSLDLPVETVIDVHAVGAPSLSASA
jgi:organic hydroperoxide reductase OsmC/OhrA